MKIQIVKNKKSKFMIQYTVDGKKRRKFFATKTDALSAIAEIENAKRNHGVAALVFNPEDRAQIDGIKRLLEQHGIVETPLEFVSRCVSVPGNRVIRQDFLTAYDEFFASKQKLNRRPATLHSIQSFVKPFCRFFAAEKSIDRLRMEDVEKYVVNPRWSPRTCRNVLCFVSTFLLFCKSRNWLSFEPVFNKKAILPKDLKKPIEFFSADTVADFLGFLETTRFCRFCGFYAIQAFCGMRHAEAERITLENIDFEARTITVPAEFSKTCDTWTMRDLPENLWTWLEKYSTIVSPDKRMRKSLLEEWGEKWVNNGLRHTFATMHVSLFQNPAKTSLILRHRNQQRLWQNYLANPVSAEEAKRYFSIFPKKSLD